MTKKYLILYITIIIFALNSFPIFSYEEIKIIAPEDVMENVISDLETKNIYAKENTNNYYHKSLITTSTQNMQNESKINFIKEAVSSFEFKINTDKVSNFVNNTNFYFGLGFVIIILGIFIIYQRKETDIYDEYDFHWDIEKYHVNNDITETKVLNVYNGNNLENKFRSLGYPVSNPSNKNNYFY